ncbi:hypothetical protein Vadar_018352 [Vaccinium darrowii]|uniref:Uncharacterized protein n=1 Tax=Vaccinium darrowii TaxID=229202 RepID=A0ACB7ZDH6_9ERIC|nr:hypothetical protein Vadar_018352 [Vaccinium darrowii]
MPLLESLAIDFCINLVSFPNRGLPAPKLSSLWVWGCEKLKALPEQMHTLLPSLQSLRLSSCLKIQSFPEGGLPSKLRTLEIWNCKKLVGGRRGRGLQTLPSLTRFTLSGGDVVESFPEEGLLPSTLTSLHIERMPNLKALIKSGLQLLGSLKYMEIKQCPQLKSLPEGRLPTSLFVLRITDCPLMKPHCKKEEGEDWHKIAHVPVIIMDGEAFFDQVHLGFHVKLSCSRRYFLEELNLLPSLKFLQHWSKRCNSNGVYLSNLLCFQLHGFKLKRLITVGGMNRLVLFFVMLELVKHCELSIVRLLFDHPV